MRIDSGCPNRTRLGAFLRGSTAPADALAIKTHLERCEACRAVVLSLSSRLPLTERKRSPYGPAPAANDASEAEEVFTPGPSYPFLLPPAAPDEIGRLGNYRVLRLLGEGGMGYVFHAVDIALGRAVALKVMKPEAGGAEGWQRFLREARTLAAIKHEHLVTLYQAGQEGNAIYFAMELLAGESLEDRLYRAPRLDAGEVVRLGRDIASGLGVLHERGLIHRDLKPANLWLEAPGGRVKILDLGLARLARDDVHLTQTGILVGTPGYMSPEQARDESLDARTDLFSLGCILYCLCTGVQPFQGGTTMAVLTALATATPRPASVVNPRIPRALSELIAQLMAKDPEDRPPSAGAVRQRLEDIERGTPAHRPEPSAGTLVLDSRPQEQTRPRGVRGRVKVALAILLALGGAFAARGLVGGLLVAGSPADSVISPATPARATAYLSELTAIQRENWPFQLPHQPPDAQTRYAVWIRGKESPHGIFMHPPPHPPGMPASLSYRLGKHFTTFRAGVSLNDGPPGSELPCTFAVFGDGRLLWRSRPVRTQADAQECTISVQRVDVLRIAVTCPGPPHGAHAVWLEPCVLR